MAPEAGSLETDRRQLLHQGHVLLRREQRPVWIHIHGLTGAGAPGIGAGAWGIVMG